MSVGHYEKRARGQRGVGVPAVVELLAGLALVILAAWQLTADNDSAPSFAVTILLIVVLLVGVALMYLGYERGKDARRAAKGDDERF